MALKKEAILELARTLKAAHDEERPKLDVARRYVKGRQALPAVVPSSAAREMKTLARISRVNICKIVVESLTQAMFVDGFRAEKESDNGDIWKVWQKNRLDARQTGIHRATFTYGAAYAVVLPGDTAPVIRGVSPRKMTALYGSDPDWPDSAIEDCGIAPNGGRLWRVYDETSIYYLTEHPPKKDQQEREWSFDSSEEHQAKVTPIVRFLDEDDLDSDNEVDPQDESDLPILLGQVAPLFSIQDQIDLTTFNLLVAQHFAAFRQRYIIGWTADSEEEKMKASASNVWTFDDDEKEIKVGEFEQTNLDGYIQSREASLRHGAALSQTPVHELIGDLINLSAEALAAAEAGKDRKVDERQTLAGESWEQVLWLAGKYANIEVDDASQVKWRETSARAFAATVDALGKLVQMLGIPPQELWEKVPGATQQDVERWKASAEKGDSFAFLEDLLKRQVENNLPPAQPPTPAAV